MRRDGLHGAALLREERGPSASVVSAPRGAWHDQLQVYVNVSIGQGNIPCVSLVIVYKVSVWFGLKDRTRREVFSTLSCSADWGPNTEAFPIGHVSCYVGVLALWGQLNSDCLVRRSCRVP